MYFWWKSSNAIFYTYNEFEDRQFPLELPQSRIDYLTWVGLKMKFFLCKLNLKLLAKKEDIPWIELVDRASDEIEQKVNGSSSHLVLLRLAHQFSTIHQQETKLNWEFEITNETGLSLS